MNEDIEIFRKLISESPKFKRAKKILKEDFELEFGLLCYNHGDLEDFLDEYERFVDILKKTRC